MATQFDDELVRLEQLVTTVSNVLPALRAEVGNLGAVVADLRVRLDAAEKFNDHNNPPSNEEATRIQALAEVERKLQGIVGALDSAVQGVNNVPEPSSEVVEPVEPTEPTEPVESTTPTEPVEPSEPVVTEPVEPTEPTTPAPVEPSEPSEPASK